MIGCMVVAIILAKQKGYKGVEGKFSWANLGKATIQAIPSLSLIVVVIGGIIAGVFTATEGSAIAVVYALLLGVLYKNITAKNFWAILVDSAKMSGMIVFLIGVSNILSWVMAFTGIPDMIANSLLGLTSNKYILLLIINIVGSPERSWTLRRRFSFTHDLLPIAKSFGMHPVHFGLILVYNLCIGNITPPVGNTLCRYQSESLRWRRLCPIC